MDKIGIIKQVDNLGRVVIPKDYRDRFMLSSEVELIATTEGVLMRNPKYELVKKKQA
ncbi:MAG: hypothetical protein IJX02_03605 [Clostridia bacterium]|nr:hypothetical protein [Clostridia bacterium]